jgi:hypothetical protein
LLGDIKCRRGAGAVLLSCPEPILRCQIPSPQVASAVLARMSAVDRIADISMNSFGRRSITLQHASLTFVEIKNSNRTYSRPRVAPLVMLIGSPRFRSVQRFIELG